MNLYRLLFLVVIGGVTLTGSACSVYRPAILQLPAIRAAHEAEVNAGVDLNGFIGINGAYSPVKHLLITAAGSGSWHAPTTSNRHRQALQRQGQIGLGAYFPIDERNVLSVIVGAGKAHSFDSEYQADIGLGRTFPSTHQEDYLIHAYTQQKFLQTGWQTNASGRYTTCQFGFAYRLGFLQYKRYQVIDEIRSREGELLSREEVSYSLPSYLRHDVWAQLQLGSNNFPAVQFRLGLGSSASTTPNGWQNPTKSLIHHTEVESQGIFLGQASLVFYPHLLKKKSSNY
ncbi:MAG TPA: hypothetical protein VF598_14100, partial [Hymenobacter sp.]